MREGELRITIPRERGSYNMRTEEHYDQLGVFPVVNYIWEEEVQNWMFGPDEVTPLLVTMNYQPCILRMGVLRIRNIEIELMSWTRILLSLLSLTMMDINIVKIGGIRYVPFRVLA